MDSLSLLTAGSMKRMGSTSWLPIFRCRFICVKDLPTAYGPSPTAICMENATVM